MTVRHTRDTLDAFRALALGPAAIALVDADLGAHRVLDFVVRLRVDHGIEWAPLIVAGRDAHLSQNMRRLAPGAVDQVIAKPLLNDELQDALLAGRRVVSLHRMFESTLNRVSEAVVVIDEGGRIRGINGTAERLFQWPSRDVLGTDIARLLPALQRQEHDGRTARSSHFARARAVDMGRIDSGLRRDGSRLPLHLAVSDISDSMGTRFVVVMRDLSGGQAAENMRQQSMHDTLTGLPNHVLALEQLHGACDAARDEGEGLALIAIDIDQFRPINDTYGHAAGDTVLKSFARRLRHGLSKSDVVARMGGDEFLVLLRGIRRAAHAESALRRLEASLAQPFVAGAHKVAVGISAGLAVYGVDGTTPESLLLAVEGAMQARKRVKAVRNTGRSAVPNPPR